MKISVSIDSSALQAKGARLQKRLAFAAAQALNDTALDIQLAERANLDRKFTVRKNAFFYRLVKITFASVSKDRAFAEIYIDDTKQRVLLSRFEKGGARPALGGGKNVAVPITGSPARPSFRDPVKRSLTFQRLQLRLHTTKTGKRQWKGQSRTFLIPNIGVFQRISAKGRSKKKDHRTVSFNVGDRAVSFTARKQSTTKLLYRLKPKPLLKAVLDFVKVAQKEFAERWAKNFQRRFNR